MMLSVDLDLVWTMATPFIVLRLKADRAGSDLSVLPCRMRPVVLSMSLRGFSAFHSCEFCACRQVRFAQFSSLTRRVRVHAEAGHFLHDTDPLYQVPRSVSWGLLEMKNVLCFEGSPLRVTFVGEFQSSYAAVDPHGRSGFPVEVNLLRERNRAGLSDMQGRYNPNRLFGVDKVTATRPVCPQLAPFPVLLDGTEKSMPAQMPTLSWLAHSQELFPRHMVCLSWDAPRRGDNVMLVCSFKRSSARGFWVGDFALKRVVVICCALIAFKSGLRWDQPIGVTNVVCVQSCYGCPFVAYRPSIMCRKYVSYL
ncbi:hypothetical protein LXA43DRAFT_61302 [Ganoderma leucocontextum]|nr:hypothetical protein LXA43DRAFT_61302 [Ganoderma leucocontextum]